MKTQLRKQFLRFALSGGLAQLLLYVILGVGTEVLNWSAAFASGFGYICGSVLVYVLNYFYTFNHNRPHGTTVMRFYIMVFIGWSLNTLIMYLAVDIWGGNIWVFQILATGLVFIGNFWLSRKWVFAHA
jgi:putative flippase GtrA